MYTVFATRTFSDVDLNVLYLVMILHTHIDIMELQTYLELQSI